ncbi:hypothetical protein EVA_11873 [gut metagenome]|uniref:Uncharacterized protein n=1 Tax=gut metagenome TaxID=749906 RepID=J9FZL1_9ZZZZ
MKYKVSDVHYIINWTKTNNTQTILQPIRTLLYGNTLDCQT